MTTIKTLIAIEDILLNSNNDFRYEYSLDELLKSEKYIKEIGEITSLYFDVQFEYGNIVNDTEKIQAYADKLSNDKIDVDISTYISFIYSIKHRFTNEKYHNKMNLLIQSLSS